MTETSEMTYGTTRSDPVGTVREHDDGTTAVKVSMGDDTGKGQHVWCWMRPDLEVRWLHHLEVAEWAIAADGETEWGERIRKAGDGPPPESVDVLRSSEEGYLVRGHLGWVWSSVPSRAELNGAPWEFQTTKLVGTLTEMLAPDREQWAERSKITGRAFVTSEQDARDRVDQFPDELELVRRVAGPWIRVTS